jgi:hypothetical protein
VAINNILQNTNHPKIVLSQLKSADGLPFKDILSSEMIGRNMSECVFRDRIFTPYITMWGFLSQVLSDDQSCQTAVAHVIAYFVSLGQEPPSANTAAYSKARSRLPEELISSLAKESASQLEEQTPSSWLWREKHIKLIDGSTLFMPDTPENQAAYPQSRNQKPGLGFPISRIVAIISYATGAILDLAISCCFGKRTGEHALLRQLLGAFKPGDIALGDCYYGSFFLIAALMRLDVDAVFPIHYGRNHNFRKGKWLGKKDHVVQWKKPQQPEWMSHEEYGEFPDAISIREVEIHNKRKGFRSQSRIIVTTFLDPKCVSTDDLQEIYGYRWCVELDLRSIKDTMRMGILRGKTPLMVRKEIWAHILAYNLVRKIMAQAAVVHGKKPRDLSFKLAVQAIGAFRCIGVFSEAKYKMYVQLLKAIAYKTVGNRPGRYEPRRLKRRPKNYPLLIKPRSQYHHACPLS